MLKHQIIQDIFVICAVFSAGAILLYRWTRREEPAQGEAGRLGVVDLLGAGGIFLLYFALHSMGKPGPHPPDPNRLDAIALIASMGIQMVLGGMVLAVLAARVNLARFLGLRWAGWGWIFLLAPAGLVLTWVFTGVLEAAGYIQWVEQLLNEPPLQEAVMILQTSKDPILLGSLIIAVVIVAPLTEELLFRGYLYPVLKRFTGVSFAGVMSGLIFATAHGELAALPTLFFLGVLLALLYERTGSIWAPIGLHALFNSVTVLVSLLPRFLPQAQG
jgi:membrane protease YdiL (CAAX protease family)